MPFPPRLIMALAIFTVSVSSVSAASLSPDLLAWLQEGYALDERADVIVQLSAPLSEMDEQYLFGEAETLQRFEQLQMIAATIPARSLPRWAAHPKVRAISLDRAVKATGAGQNGSENRASLIRKASGAWRAMENNFVDGEGIGVAILDSGHWKGHKDLDKQKQISVVPSLKTDDKFGHGTHVASIIAGTGKESEKLQSDYTGLAPAASLFSLKVLGDDGQGTVSGVLAGVDWVLGHHQQMNIRVVNMSFGAAAIESFRTDPLCQATLGLYNAGIVTVVSAGNFGKSLDGAVAFGTITTPGNSPWVITVGAVNDHGTSLRSDDTIAGYSSRGPTRSYDAFTGRFDHLIKPELVAPGNLVIAAEAKNSKLKKLMKEHGIADEEKNDKYISLSGTSMSAPMVSGVVALMLETNPDLTPALVKGILMYTAQTLPGYSVFEQGSGLLNGAGAVTLAERLVGRIVFDPTAPMMLEPSEMPYPVSSVAGENVLWSQGRILLRRTNDGPLVEAGGILFAENIVFGEGVLFAEGLLFAEQIVFSNGLLFAEAVDPIGPGAFLFEDAPLTPDAYLDASGLLFAETAILGHGDLLDSAGYTFAQGVLFAEGLLFAEAAPALPEGMALASEPIIGEGILFTEGSLLGSAELETLFGYSSNALIAGEACSYDD